MINVAIKHDAIKPDVEGYPGWLERLAASYAYYIRDITYILSTDNHLLTLNKEYLDHNFYTDILTFDRTEDKELAGDVYISLDRVQDNAKAYDVSFETELRRVMAHGILHMVGMKDSTGEEKQKMRQAEDTALELFHVKQ